MPKYHQDGDHISDGVNLLISILVRFPEIGTVNYNAKLESLKLTFMVSGLPENHDFSATRRFLMSSLAAYHMLEGYRNNVLDVGIQFYGDVAMLTVLRDVRSLTRGEIGLIISLMKDQLGKKLVIDQNDSLLEEDLLLQEEVIDDMLVSVRKDRADSSLLGIREDGKVLVFNK